MIRDLIANIYMYLHDNHREWFYNKFGPGTGGIGEAYIFIIKGLAIIILIVLASIIGIVLWWIK